MNLTYGSVVDFGLERTAALLNGGFADYFVKFHFDPATLLAAARVDSVDYSLSRTVFLDGEPVGVAHIARRGWTSRLAGMAIIPEARGKKVGRAFMEHLLAEARVRGDRAMELEVIEQNPRAVRLYESVGFLKMRRLAGYAGAPAADAGPGTGSLEQLDIREFARLVAVHGFPDLPWQISAATLVHLSPPTVAYRGGAAAVLISDPSAPQIVIRGLLTEAAARGRGHALGVVRSLFAKHPGKTWRVPAFFPEEMGAVFAQAGLAPTEISQWQMIKALHDR
jgi:ribosomal protein S18 acetylase RimI-like enzyme